MNLSVFRATVLIGILSSAVLAQTSGPTYFFLRGDTVMTRADSLRLKVGNVLFWSTGKDIGTSATPARYTYSDSVKVQKIQFKGAAETSIQPGTIRWDSTQRTFKGWQYIVDRSFDMTHAVLTADVLDSNSVAETTLITVAMGANYPAVGKMVMTNIHGEYAAAGGGAKTITFRWKKGATVLDSLVITTAAGGTSLRGFQFHNAISFRAIGSSGKLESFSEFDSESGNTLAYSRNVAINTTTTNDMTLTVQLSATGATYVRAMQGWAETKN